jgi:hypothetical protein
MLQRITGQKTAINEYMYFEMSEELQHYMSFNPSCSISPDSKSFKTSAKRLLDANRGLHLMHAYCSVATHTIIGDTKTPRFRICNAFDSHGDMFRETFVHSHYVPVGRREFNRL